MTPYPTPDGGELLHAYQVPASVNGDANLDAPEYLQLHLCQLSGPPPPADLDGDCDVDLDDFGAFQACVTGPALGPPGSGCDDADLDDDGDVDQSDFGLFQRCLSGESVPGDPDCAGA